MNQIEISKDFLFYEETETLSGVKKIASLVRKDIELVTGSYPSLISSSELKNTSHKNLLIYGTLGHSPILDSLIAENLLDISSIKNKREAYAFTLIKIPFWNNCMTLVIAGSDKRGTIYGLFHLSELMGISPLVNWSHVIPVRKEKIVLDESVRFISKEPSVKYRGIFINDEWPAFGSWAQHRFGGINAQCYEHIFELILRLKGNYLWPAMWASNFSLDGPGLRSAELADELGIVMSTSHHEPCMRSGGEYALVRGEDSIYGDAWDFHSNREGILRFWNDGLLRNKSFENVITMGMRGENDTAIMENATLSENIELLRDILHEQNKLIRETIDSDLHHVPRQMVLFTEVESFFYGDANTQGLLGDPELEGVTLMLSDNNAGYTRTLPTAEMRPHQGGYGMYYHMDMHGGPYSYQWVGSTYLCRVWEQMTMAYDFGVQEIWVVNVGDIATQECAMSYFLDLAYNMDSMGSSHPNETALYLKNWVKNQFSSAFSEQDLDVITEIISKYTLMCERRKHEIMNDQTYHPVHFNESEQLLEDSEWIIQRCDQLLDKCPSLCQASFYELLYYPAVGTANLMKAWVLASRNAFYAQQNRTETNVLAGSVVECLSLDDHLTARFHEIADGKFYGFGLSEHFGFRHWSDANDQYPIRQYIRPANKTRMIVAKHDSTAYNIGDCWIDNRMTFSDFLRPDCSQIVLDIACSSISPIAYELETKCPWIKLSKKKGETALTDHILISIDRTLLKGREDGLIKVKGNNGSDVFLTLEADSSALPDYPPMTFIEYDHYIAMEANHYSSMGTPAETQIICLSPYGRSGCGMKVFPSVSDFHHSKEMPFLTYSFVTSQAGIYEAEFYMAPSTPVDYDPRLDIGTQVNGQTITLSNTVWDTDIPYFLSPEWAKEAQDNIKIYRQPVLCQKGFNQLTFYFVSPNITLERIILHPEEKPLPASYLGPKESFYIKQLAP